MVHRHRWSVWGPVAQVHLCLSYLGLVRVGRGRGPHGVFPSYATLACVANACGQPHVLRLQAEEPTVGVGLLRVLHVPRMQRKTPWVGRPPELREVRSTRERTRLRWMHDVNESLPDECNQGKQAGKAKRKHENIDRTVEDGDIEENGFVGDETKRTYVA